MPARDRPPGPGPAGDLSVAALYTSGAWAWARLPGSELLASRRARAVFDGANLALALPRALRGAPSLPCSLVQRHVMIDRLATGAPHVLELAAGLSPRGVTLTADPKVTVTEVDLEPVMRRKRMLLARTAAGRSVLARANLRLVEADLREAGLQDPCWTPEGAPLFVIAEGLLMYLDADAQRALWRRVRALFDSRPGTLVFDLVPSVEQPRPGAAGRAFGRMFRLATRGATFARDARTREDVAAELRAIGFTVELLEPADAPESWQVPFRDRRTQQLLFVCRVRATSPVLPAG
jgi:O-methyltransferase involved in polyketide biosynthesis